MKKLILNLMFGAGIALATISVTASAATAGLESITYLLPAPKTTPGFAPWLIAQEEGYFREVGLDVSFLSTRGGVEVAKQIGAGNALIGGGMGDTSVIVRANGVPVKAVAVLGAGTLTFIASMEKDPVNIPAQLKGRTITVISYADTVYYSLLATLKKAGLTRDDVNIQAAGPTGVWQLFAAGKASVMAGVAGWVVSARETGAKVHLMDPKQGFGSMAQAILVSDETIAKNPQLVQKVVTAALRGMALIMKDPDAAVAAYVRAVPTYKGHEAQIRQVFDLFDKYVYANQKVLGKMDADRLAKIQDFYVSEGIVSKATPLSELYTNQFVGAAN